MPRSQCPSGKPCLYYSDAIDAGPDMDGCVGGCRRPSDADRSKLVSIASVEVDWRMGVVSAQEAMIAITAIMARK